VIYADGPVRPAITPDDTEQVAMVLAGHGVILTSVPEPGLC